MQKTLNKKENIFFNTKKSHLSLLVFLISLVILIAIFGVGCAFDLEICHAFWDGLGHQEKLGRAVSGILSNVQFFFIDSIIISFAIASISYWNKNKLYPILSFVLAIAAGMFLSYFQKECFQSEIEKLGASADLAWWIMALTWVVTWSGAFCFSWLFISRRVDNKLMVRAGLFLILGSVLVTAGNNYFWKFVWSRPRPTAVLKGDVDFRPVWELHPFECFNTSVPYAKDLKSFPSGLVSGAAVFLIVVVGLTSLDVFKTKKTKNIYLYLSMGFMIIIAIARMIAACHFLTDVTAAAITGLVIAYFMPWCYKRNNGNLLW
ncbi:MAG: phosphatase PAP2 family protein [Mycoplasma sp.]|nr:phosphatase PAP2 family protein [Candidatus Hennigella equi]